MKYLIVLSLFLSSTAAFAYHPSMLEDMPFVVSQKFCRECHTQEEVASFAGRTAESCNVYCSSCHDDLLNLNAHHKVDQRMTKKIPEGIKLLNNRIACFTCHQLTSKRYDDASWKAESLFESMFKSKKTYKTYFLIVRNNEGQLCKMCH